MKLSGLAILTLIASLSLAAAWPTGAEALTPLQMSQTTGLSVEAKTGYSGGFDFRFGFENQNTTLTIDPLGHRHTASSSLTTKDGSISLNGRFDRTDRMIKITATRSGKQIGEYSWRVEAVLR
jgi:hypothetical protein